MVLLERDAVLAELAAHLAAVVSGRGRLMLLSGEAGVGKSAVLRQFARETGGQAAVLWGWCEPLSTPRPLGPWLDLAEDLGGRVQYEIERSDGGGGVSQVFRALLEALVALGDAKVLVFEDVHWADAATLDLIRLLARRLEGRRVLLVASFRDDEIGPGHPLRALLGDLARVPTVHRCSVEPLTASAVATLAAGRGVDADEVYRVTGGNPFFVTEVLATSANGIPKTVGQAVVGRLARVSPAARRVAELVAILGSAAPVPLIADLVESADDRLAELFGAGVVSPMGDGVGFRHELARMAVLEAIPVFEQVAWDGRVLERLRADPVYSHDIVLLAHHAEAARNRDAVLEYAPVAAAGAAAAGAHREAAAQYARALRFGVTLAPQRRAALLEGFAQAGLFSGQLPEAVEARQEAVRLRTELGDQLREGDGSRALAITLWQSSRCAEAWESSRRAVRVLESIPSSRELGWAYLNTCQLSTYNQDGAAVARESADRAIRVAETFGDHEVIVQARFHRWLSNYISAECQVDDSWMEMERARVDGLKAGFVESAGFMAMLMATYAVTHRDFERATAARDALEELGRGRDIVSYLVVAQASEPLRLMYRGQWDQATDLAAPALGRPGAGAVTRIMPSVSLGLIRARRGDPGAPEPIDEVLDAFEPVGWVLLAYAARAEVAWLAGDDARARSEARRGLAATTEHSDPWTTGELARWLVLAGGDPPVVRAAGPFAWELAGDWHEAAAGWDQLGCPYDAGLARLSGDVPALLHAMETFGSLGARSAAAIARARLRTHGVRPGTRGPRPATRANPHGLTSRQLEILEQVAQGLTDSQIAARLHLSPKTVNQHVTATFSKLGVHNRADAVAKLARWTPHVRGGPISIRRS